LRNLESMFAKFIPYDEKDEDRDLSCISLVLASARKIWGRNRRTLMYDAINWRTSNGSSKNGPIPLKSTKMVQVTSP
jgi:hypothetical protein